MTSKVSSWIPDQLNHSQDNVLFFKQIRTGAILVLIVCLFVFLTNFIHFVNMFAISFLDSSLSLNFSLNYGSTVDSVLTTIDTFNVNQS